MADAVVNFYDSSRRLTVGTGFLGFVCRRTGSGKALARQGGNTNQSTILIDVTGYQYPVVLFQIADYGVAFFNISADRKTLNYASAAPVGTDYNYFIFDWTRDLAPTANSLFRVWRKDRTIAFDSGYWPMKVVAALDGGQGGAVSATGDVVFACGPNAFGGHNRVDNPYCFQPEPGADDGDLTRCRDIRGQIDGKIYGGYTQNGGKRAVAANVSVNDVLGRFGNTAEYDKGTGRWEAPNFIFVADVGGIPLGRTFF